MKCNKIHSYEIFLAMNVKYFVANFLTTFQLSMWLEKLLVTFQSSMWLKELILSYKLKKFRG